MTFLYILTIPRGVEQELPTDDDVHHLGSGVRSQHLSIASIKVWIFNPILFSVRPVESISWIQ